MHSAYILADSHPSCPMYTYAMNICVNTGVTQSHQNELAQAPEQSLAHSYTSSYGENPELFIRE